MELFFDLVFVLAIAELAHYLHGHLSVGGFLGFTFLFLPVWLVWSNTYPPTEASCSALRDELTLLRGSEETVIRDEIGRYPDHAGLLRYG